MAARSLTVPIGVLAASCVMTAGLVVFAHRRRERNALAPASEVAAPIEDDAEAEAADEPTEAPPAAQDQDQGEDQAPVRKRAGRNNGKSSSGATTLIAPPLAPIPDPDGTVRSLLSPAVGPKAPKPADVVDRLAALGPQVLPQLIGAVCGDFALPDVAAGTTDGDIDADVLEQREQIVRDAIARFTPAQQLDAIVKHAAGADVHRRMALIQLLGTVEHDDALQAILDVAQPIEPIDLRRSYVREPIETALTARVAAHRGVSRKFTATFKDQNPELLALLGRAGIDAASIAGGELVAELLGRSPELDGDLLEALSQINPQTHLALPDEGIDVVRRHLTDADEDVRRSATIALGALRDDSAMKDLIDLLSADDERLAEAAHWSLRSIALVDRGATPEAWTAWLTEQKTWRDEHQAEVVAKLESERLEDVVDGMSALLERPCYRRETVAAIQPLLTRAEPEVFRAAVAALESIGSGRAVEALQTVATQGDPQRRGYATAALKRMSAAPAANANGD